MVTKWDFLEMEASLWLNGRSQDVAKGWLSTKCCWEAAVHTLDLSWRRLDVKLMMMMMMMMMRRSVSFSDGQLIFSCSIKNSDFSLNYARINNYFLIIYALNFVNCYSASVLLFFRLKELSVICCFAIPSVWSLLRRWWLPACTSVVRPSSYRAPTVYTYQHLCCTTPGHRPIHSLFTPWRTVLLLGRCGSFFRPNRRVCLSTSLVALLLLMSGVESNPGSPVPDGDAERPLRRAERPSHTGDDHIPQPRRTRDLRILDLRRWSGCDQIGFRSFRFQRDARSTPVRDPPPIEAADCASSIAMNSPSGNTHSSGPWRSRRSNANSCRSQVPLSTARPTQPIVLANIYRPPSSTVPPDFYDEISDLLLKVGDIIDAGQVRYVRRFQLFRF